MIGRVLTQILVHRQPEVVVIALTGNGRFFSSGADVKGEAGRTPTGPVTGVDMRMHQLTRGATALEMIRALIDSTKVIAVHL